MLLFRSHLVSASVLALLTDIRSRMSSRSPTVVRTCTCFSRIDASPVGKSPIGYTTLEEVRERFACACTYTRVAAWNKTPLYCHPPFAAALIGQCVH